MAFYANLWHMPCDIKCHKVWQYGYQKNRIDQTNWSMGYWTLRIEKNEAKNAKNLNVNFSYVFSFVILKCKIAKEDAIFEKSLFCEKCLEYDFTWKKCWFQIKIQNFILMTRPTNHIQTTNHKLVGIDLRKIMYLQYVYIRRPFSNKETLREDKNSSTEMY